MNVNNLFRKGSREDGSILKLVLSIQFAMLGIIGLDFIGLKIPFIRQAIGFIYLTFIPGFLILKVLKLNKLNAIENLLFSTGLSLSFLMFIGLFINMAYPILLRPISTLPIIVTLTMIIVALCIGCYTRNVHFNTNFKNASSIVHNRSFLFLPPLLIFILTILGTYLVNFYENNILLLTVIVTMALIVSLISLDDMKKTFSRIYPLLVVIFSISLLYHRSLVPLTLSGYGDVHYECYFQKLVMTISRWNYELPYESNAMLSATILPATYSVLLDVDSVWVIKVIYPLFFMLVPLGLYYAYSKQTEKDTAFLSIFFFISFFVFFGEMIWLTKQQVAELFLVLLIILMLNDNIERTKKEMLSIIFCISLIISHYGLSYIFLFLISMGLLLKKIMKNSVNSKFVILSRNLVALCFVVALSWYMYVSGGVTFETFTNIPYHIISTISSELFNPMARDPNVLRELGMTPMISPQREVARILFYITQFFIAVGVLELVVKRNLRQKFNKEYTTLVFISMGILLLCIILPYFASQLSMRRIYHITLIFLSPFCILGGKAFFTKLFKLKSESSIGLLILIVLVPYFLFNTGFIYEVTGDIPSSVSLSMKRFEESSDEVMLGVFYSQLWIPEQDVVSVTWLSNRRIPGIPVYADTERIIWSYGMIVDDAHHLSNDTKIDGKAYIYLKYVNVVKGIMLEYHGGVLQRHFAHNITEILPLIEMRDKIYSNGASEIYHG